MSCKYIINGKEYNESQVERIIVSNMSLPSFKTITSEESIQRIKDNVRDRFINVDLFTPYQEMSYTRMITSFVIDKLGVLKPGVDFTVSPTQVFLEAKSLFENSRNKFKYLESIIDTQEKLDNYKSNAEVLKVYPELSSIAKVEQIKDIYDQFENVLDNFDRFKTQVQINLKKYGLSIRDNKLIEASQDADEYYKSLIESGEAEETEISDREIQEGFEDGNVFRINPRDTASTRVKLLFSSIPSTTRNIFGIREFVDYDTIIEDILRTGSELESVDFDSLVKSLLNKSYSRPYLKNVVAKLAQLKTQNNTQLLNEVLTFANKAYQEQTLVLWNNKTGAVETKVIKSNRNTVIRQITYDWLEQQKFSPIVKTDDSGELMINRDKVKELKDSLETVRQSESTAEQKREWVKTFLKSVGVDFNDGMINDFQIRADKQVFRKQNRNLSFNQLFEDNNFFSNILETYSKIPAGTTESKYDDINNGMKDEASSFSLLAEIYYEHSPNRYQTGSSQNGEGKSIYAYIQPSMLENLKRKLKGSSDYLDKILGRSFSRTSEVALKIRDNIVSGVKNFTFEFHYMDSLKKDRKNQDGVVRKNMSNKEQIFDALLKHQNGGQRTGNYNLFTLSDKTTTPTITMSKYILNDQKENRAGKDIVFTTNKDAGFKQAFNFKKDFKNELYRLAEGEINRIQDYVNTPDKSTIDIKNFGKSYKFFYLFPVLNRSDNTQLNEVKEKIFSGQPLTEDDKTIVKEVLANSLKSGVETTFNNWVSNGVIVPKYDESKTVIDFEFPLFDATYMGQKELNGLSSFEKAIYAVTDMKFNYLRAQVNSLQLLGADPALFFKMPKTGVDVVKDDKGVPILENGKTVAKTFEQYTDSEKLNIVLSTMDEFSKRAAMFIAPGAQGVWTWTDSMGNTIDRSSYKTVTLADYETDSELFKGINVTDAQEFITVQEHIDRMMSEGKIPMDIWESITKKVENNPSGRYTLEDREREFVVQPTKPVYTNTTDLGTFPRIDYVKSSTYVLIPEILEGTELDELRKFLEKEQIRSAAFESAKKTGQASKITKVFDDEGKFIDPGKYTAQVLDREGLHTQMEIPYQKDHITNVSQMNRTLFDGLLDIKNFTLEATGEDAFTGKEFKELKENARVAQFMKSKKAFMERFAIQEKGNNYIFSDNAKLVELLREEAMGRNFSLNDINAIKLDSAGDLVYPLYLMPRGEKFEGLLNSLINHNIQLKNPGTSLVQVSAVGTKVKFSELDSKTISQMIYTESYDPTKGLQYMRKENGIVKPAQVFISRYLKDENENIIDLADFVIESNGRKILDPTRISKEVFNLVGSRIPNQGHPSMLPIEVVGFLPEYMESTVVVPDGITAQMGSDFDVDKLYAYLTINKFKYNRKAKDLIKGYNDRIKELKADTDAVIDSAGPDAEKVKARNNREIADLRGLIKEAKTGNVQSIDHLSYDLSKYDGTHESLMNLDDDELNQLYRDIHWSVLVNPATFSKITTSIDFDDVKSEVSLLDKIGLYPVNPDVMPFDLERQIQVFNDNKGGKVGVGIFASLGSFLADNQDKNIFLGQTIKDEKTGQLTTVKDPVKVLSKDGRVLELYKVTEQGQVGSGKSLRTKGDNNSIIMTESVDNAKNKNMYRFNWHPKLLSAVQGFIALSTEDNEIHDVTFVTRLFPQQVLKEYVDLIENAQDSLSQYQENVKENINKQLTDKYLSMMTSAAQDEFLLSIERATKEEDYEHNEIFSAARLLDLLKTSTQLRKLEIAKSNGDTTASDKLDSYYRAQLDILDLYNRLDGIGGELSTIIGASYIYTKGIGSNIFSVTDNIRKLGKLASSSTFVNLEQLAGKVSVEGGIVSLDPRGEIGHSIQNSLFFAKSLYKTVFPVHFSSWFNTTVDIILTNAGVNKEKIGSERYIKLHKRIFAGVRSFMFSSNTLEIFDNPNEERARLLVDTTENDSLAKRITKARVDNPELLDNYFFKRLDARVNSRQGEPSTIRYKSPFSDDIDELANNRGFLELILSGKEDLINIAKDLVKYSFVIGGNETSGSFSKFIPVEYLLADEEFSKGLKTLTDNLSGNGSKFIKQFIQNNPDLAKGLKEDEFSDILQTSSSQDIISIPKGSKIFERLLVQSTYDERRSTGELTKLPDYVAYNDYKNDRVLLYQKRGAIESNTYARINTLGSSKSGFVEYDIQSTGLESIVYNNLTNDQKLDKILTNPDNVFHKASIDLTTRTREVAMADVSTKFIGNNVPNGKDAKTYIDTVANVWNKSGINLDTFTPADTVMVIGTNAYTLAKDDEYLSQAAIQEHFERYYKPKIDAAALQGAKFTVGYFSGMDEIVRKYLRTLYYQEQNSGLGYGIFTNNAEPDISFDGFDDSDIASGDFLASLDPMDNLDMDTLAQGDISDAPQSLDNLFGKKPTEVPKTPSVIALTDNFTRSSVSSDSNSLYLFTDNAGRTSGSNPIDPNSSYAREYGTNKKYPTMTQAVIRGLENAFPITTMVDDKRTQWTDDRFNEYKAIIDKEIDDIKNSSSFFSNIKFAAQMPFGKGQISDMRNSAPKIWAYMNEKLAEIGIDNTGIKPTINGSTSNNTNTNQSGLVPQSDIPEGLEVGQEPDYDIYDSIDPNDLLSFDNDDEEIDIDNMSQPGEKPVSKAPVKPIKPKDDFIEPAFVRNILPFGEGGTTLNQVLNNLSSTSNPFYKNILAILKQRGSVVPNIEVIIDNTTEHPGIFTDNKIIINTKMAISDDYTKSAQDNFENVLMHEIMHAYTANVINNYTKDKSALKDKELIFAKNIYSMFNDVRGKLSDDDRDNVGNVIMKLMNNEALTSEEKRKYYGLTDPFEFVSMMMTDATFQQFMNSINYDDKTNKSIFEKFKELLNRLFDSLGALLGIDVNRNSILANGINDIVSLLDSSEQTDLSSEVPDAEVNDMPLDLDDIKEPADLNKFDPYKIKTPRGLFDANDEQKVAIDKISEFFNKPLTNNFDDNIYLLYGAGGTGKTAVSSNALNKAIKDSGKTATVGFAAVTHTAKGELRSAGNENAATLASILGALPVFENGEERYELKDYDEMLANGQQLPAIFSIDWLVIDEASMLGTREQEMIKQRVQERGKPMKILFMGDHVQIPPVGERPDMDGFAIDLRKNDTRSTNLVKIERTKNIDIADLGSKFRRAVDYYNSQIETTGSSSKSNLPAQNILMTENKISSDNILYTTSEKDFTDRYIDVFKKDSLNPRNCIIITYNNENHPSVLQTTATIRQQLFGSGSENSLFLPGEPISIKSTIAAKTDKGEQVELGTNERVFIKSIKQTTKTYKVGTAYSSRNITAPIYEIVAIDKNGNTVRFNALDKAVTSQFTKENYDQGAKGYRMMDGSIFKYADKKALESTGLTDIYHSYMVSAHKVQGQTFNHSFVADKNIARYVNMSNGQGGVILTPKSYAQIAYTAISRAREKVYFLTDAVSSKKGEFIEPVITPVEIKSVATTDNPNTLYILENQCGV